MSEAHTPPTLHKYVQHANGAIWEKDGRRVTPPERNYRKAKAGTPGCYSVAAMIRQANSAFDLAARIAELESVPAVPILTPKGKEWLLFRIAEMAIASCANDEERRAAQSVLSLLSWAVARSEARSTLAEVVTR